MTDGYRLPDEPATAMKQGGTTFIVHDSFGIDYRSRWQVAVRLPRHYDTIIV